MPEQTNTFFIFHDANEAQNALRKISDFHIEHSAFQHVVSWRRNRSPHVVQIDFAPLLSSELGDVFTFLAAVEVTKDFRRIWP